MELVFAPRDVLQIDDAIILFRNFAGREDEYNRAGERNFAVKIPTQEMADALRNAGWNVTIRQPRNPDEDVFMFLKVKVKFNEYGPNVYVNSNGNVRKLTEETVGNLDNIYLERVDLDIRPHDWNFGGRSGRTAMLKHMHVIQGLDRHTDRFAAMYAHSDDEGRLPF